MINIIKPDWEKFKAKFSENPQPNFEWLCYLLFCREFKQDKGIFRYKNQSAIETNPIKKENEVIGWQAKFYETSLSKHKNEILETLDKAKKDYPNITKLLFYTNQEWGQAKRQKPKGLEEVEEKAKELNIKLEWRTASFFESEFVSIENKIIAKHFFTFDKSVFDLIDQQRKHTENILNQIHTYISFNGQTVEIDRKDVLSKLTTTKEQVIILSGVAGVGKTAIIKKYYEQVKNAVPFYVYKATEFNNLRNINEFFKDFDFYEFIEAHKNEGQKIIVIDSVEKLLDIENRDPFKEFLSILLKEGWKIIFTTRNNYLEDLNYRFFEIYNIPPTNISVNKLELDELYTISENYSFLSPKDGKLQELLRIPFYLNEYLNFYNSEETLGYPEFKNKLWKKIIRKSNSVRERCFLQIAFEKANSGQFFINPNCDSNILKELLVDGILGYETAGYFITHDIYEEWALEKIIESEFIKKASVKDFFNKIGESLPIRRSFRNWISEKLLLNAMNIKQFIEETIGSDVQSHWKDEILISVLLSDYSETFFEILKDELLENNQTLLKRLSFLLRLACKEVDEDFLRQLGIKRVDLSNLIEALTKPKGKGWEIFIKFAYENLDKIGIENINYILPVIYEWNSKFKKGETTRLSSLVALKYYQWIIKEDVYFSRDDTKNKLIQTILYGAAEIQEELKNIFEKILQNKWKYHRNPYYDLMEMILVPNLKNGFAGLEVAKVLPEYVYKLADLFWSYTPKREDSFHQYRIEIEQCIEMEQHFGLEEHHFDYFPASAYQTPVYWLLQYNPKGTIDFILKFTDKCVESYTKSRFDRAVKEIKLFFDGGETKEQYISHCLWNMYRGTSSPRSPYLLQSIHMALEKFFLEQGKNIESKTLEDWLLYLLKNSKSTSISAVVSSLVLAYPDKTFNVAKILFKTKEFIIQDKRRLGSEYQVKSLYSIGYDLDYHNKIYVDERIMTCDDKHRKWSLEELFLYYQFFRSEEVNEGEAEKRQKELWKILDNYYDQLPDKSKETGEDKTWKLFLARMDRRKMDITAQRTNKDIVVQLSPKLEPELKEYSEKSIAKSSEFMKYSSLKLWASYKMENDERYKQYKNYEDNPKQALKEVKEIVDEMKKNKSQEFYLFNYSIPAEVCSVLLKYHISELSKEEKEFCKDVIIEFASSSFRPNYQYQISDGVESAISVLPILFKEFPKEREIIKTILLITLFDPHNIGMYADFSDFSANAIKKLFEISFDDAQSLLFGYLHLKPKYENLRDKLQESNLIEKFVSEYQADIQKVLDNKLTYEDLGNIENLDLYILKKAFHLIPLKTNDKTHKKIVKQIIHAFVPKIFSYDRNEKINYGVNHDFLQTYAFFVLSLPEKEIYEYLKPFIDNFKASKTFAYLFQEFILAEDILNAYDNFWLVWNYFKEKVFEICKKNGNNLAYNNEIVKSYLFATIHWKENTKEWNSLKDRNKRFFKEISQEIGHYPSALYALSKLLNDIGSSYINDGIIWISGILGKNKDLVNKNLEINTIFYIENLVRKYIYNNREEIKRRSDLKQMVLIILNFLIEKGSIIGYMLREDIL